MFRSRCARSAALVAALPHRLRTVCPSGLLRPSPVLLCYAAPSFPSTMPHAPPHMAGLPPQTEEQAAPAAAAAAATRTTAPSHENVFAAPEPDALPSLFNGGRLAGTGATGLSNGEEEIVEDRAYAADDWRGDAAGPAAAAATDAADEKRGGQGGRQPQQVADPRHPMNLYGSRYGGTIRSTLMAEAERRGFYSPFWSSRAAFAQSDATVEVSDDEAVVVNTATGPVRLFNLEQTTLTDDLRMATVQEVRSHLFRRKGGKGSVLTGAERPRNLLGRNVMSTRASQLAASPRFFTWQARSPYWLTEREVDMLGAHIRPEEEDNYFAVPVVQRHGHTSGSGDGGDAAMAKEGADDSMVHMYNLAQTTDMVGRMAQLPAPVKSLPPCYGGRGTRYGVGLTWLVWEYCARYHFPLDEEMIAMVTLERVQSLGGTVLEAKRYPRSSPAARRSAAPPATPSQQRGTAVADTSAEAEEGVVPPPFTLMLNDEVISLYNALQTSIPDVVLRSVEEKRQEFFSGFRRTTD